MKDAILIMLFPLLMIACASSKPNKMDIAFEEANKMVEAIPIIQFCHDTFNITNYGASISADAPKNGEAIAKAIEAATTNGGGNVVIPQGEWITTPITLMSNVNLVVEYGAILKFTTEYKYFLPTVLTRWEGVDCYNLHPLIYAYGAENISISGLGIIDGQGNEQTWWYMKGRPQYGWQDGMVSQEYGGRPILLDADRNALPIEQRQMTIESGLRPQLINIYNCKNVFISDVTLRNSPFWVIHPLMVENMIVRNVKIESHGPNSDGCDPESCKNVLIEGCFFDTGDDCIAIKSGRNYDGRRWNKPSENIYVRNCRMKNGHGGVVLGSEISGGFKNLWVENCKMSSPDLERVIRIKTSNCRGGIIENVFVRNIEVGECQEAILKINLQYEPKEDCNRDFPPIVRNVNLWNVTSQKSLYGAYIIGLDDMPQNVNQITIENCNFNGVEKQNSVTNAQNVEFKNLIINESLVD